MTVLNWPTSLPRPERSNWQAQRQEGRLRRQSDAGPPTYRRRFSSAAKLVSMSLLLDRNEKAIFDNFFDYATSEGSSLFWMPDPTTDSWALLASDGTPLLIAGGPSDGMPILLGALWLCSFGDNLPSETIVGVRFRLSFSVVVLP